MIDSLYNKAAFGLLYYIGFSLRFSRGSVRRRRSNVSPRSGGIHTAAEGSDMSGLSKIRFLLFFLVIQHAVTVAFKFRVGDLVPEFKAHALVFRRSRQPARTEAPGLLQALLDMANDLRVLVETNLHRNDLLIIFYAARH